MLLFSIYALLPLQLIVRSGLDVPTSATGVTTREHPASVGGTVGEKCPVILPVYALHLGIFYMP
jgi:hypothetical protein